MKTLKQIANKIDFEYEFTSNKEAISNKHRKDVPSILALDALFVIKVNDEVYLRAEIAILEFYKSLFKWKETITEDHIREFHYYTIEYDDYKNGAILSLLPCSDKQATIQSIWSESDTHHLFNLDYIVSKFCDLERNLRRDIEHYFNINLNSFIQHIPYYCL